MKTLVPILTFLVLINLARSEETLIGSLKTIKSGVSGELHSTDEEMVLEIKNFNYDGKFTFFQIKSGPKKNTLTSLFSSFFVNFLEYLMIF